MGFVFYEAEGVVGQEEGLGGWGRGGGGRGGGGGGGGLFTVFTEGEVEVEDSALLDVEWGDDLDGKYQELELVGGELEEFRY